MRFTEEDRKEIKRIFSFNENSNKALKNISKPYKKAIPIIDIETISNNVWLFLRALIGLGGSEVAGLMGVSPYTNPIKIYDNKFNFLYRQPFNGLTDEEIEEVITKLEKNNPEPDFNSQYRLDFGHFMEEFIRDQFLKAFNSKYKDDFEDEFSKKYGKYMEIKDVEVYKDSWLYKHPYAPMFADFDYRIRIIFADGTVKEGIFECKTSDTFQINKKWEDGFPEYYNCQTRHYMAIADVDFFVICCVADNNAMHFYTHLGFRDKEYEKKLLTAVDELWYGSVIPNIKPEVNNDIDALDALLDTIDVSALSNEPNRLGLIAANLLIKRDLLVDSKKTYQAAIKGLDEEIAKIETQICQKCGDNAISIAETDDAIYTVSISESSRNLFDKTGYLKAYPEQKDKVKEYTKTSVSTKMKVKKEIKKEDAA